MNVIFLDFDGVLNTYHLSSDEDIEKRIKLLSKIVKKYDCKIVIEASCKRDIDEDTLEVDDDCKWIKYVMALFKKYDIEVIGRTTNLKRRISNYTYLDMWKDDEIRLYLFRHPEIEHYCIIDDNDFHDLEQSKDYLVQTKNFCDNYVEEGLLEKHDFEVKKILSKENNIRKFAIKHKKSK